ncbi:hypothetical protein BgiMline_011767, partial [Biomphalaria glabrata]
MLIRINALKSSFQNLDIFSKHANKELTKSRLAIIVTMSGDYIFCCCSRVIVIHP